MQVPQHVLLQVVSRPQKTNPGWGACRIRPLARPLAPGPRNPGVDEEMRWATPPIIRPKESDVRPRSNMGYVSRQNPMEGTSRVDRPFSHMGEPLCGCT